MPQFLIPPGADLEELRGGPEVTFDGLMPKPGRYRAWTQFRRHDKVHTFMTTFEVREPMRRLSSADRACSASGDRAASSAWPRAVAIARVDDDDGAVRSGDRADPEQRCVMCHTDSGLSFPLVDLRADVAAAAADANVRAASPHAAVGGGGRLRRVRQRQPPDAARDAVPRVVGRRARTAQRRQGVPQRRRSQRRGAAEVRAAAHAEHWQLGEPDLDASTRADRDRREVGRTRRSGPSSISALTSARQVRGARVHAGDRRVVTRGDVQRRRHRSVARKLDAVVRLREAAGGVAYRLPARSRIVVDDPLSRDERTRDGSRHARRVLREVAAPRRRRRIS